MIGVNWNNHECFSILQDSTGNILTLLTRGHCWYLIYCVTTMMYQLVLSVAAWLWLNQGQLDIDNWIKEKQSQAKESKRQAKDKQKRWKQGTFTHNTNLSCLLLQLSLPSCCPWSFDVFLRLRNGSIKGGHQTWHCQVNRETKAPVFKGRNIIC